MRRSKNTALICILLLWVMPGKAVCQTVNPDSLLDFLELPNDSTQGMIKVDITMFFKNLPLEKADSIIVRRITSKKHDALTSSEFEGLRGLIHAHHGKNPAAVSFFKTSLTFAEQSGDKIQIAISHWELGFHYRVLGFHSKSSEHFHRLGELTLDHDPGLAARAYYEAAVTSYHAGNIKESLQEQRKSLRMLKKIKPNALGDDLKFYVMSGFNTMGLVHQKLKHYDSAIINFTAADSVARLEVRAKFWDSPFWIAMLQACIGSVYLDMGKAEKAMPFFEQDYEMMKRFDVKQALFVRLFKVRGNLQLGRVKAAVSLMNEIKDPYAEGRVEYWQVKAQVQQASGDLSGALISLNKITEIKDSSRREAEASNISALKTIYDVSARNEDIQRLVEQNNQKQARIRLQLIVFSMSLMMLSVFVVVYYLFNKKSKAQLKIIGVQKEEMAQQNLVLREALHRLSDTQNQLIESAKMSSLGQMTAGLAHEINNPLNYISGGVQALDQSIKELVTISNKTEKKQTEEIQREIDGMLRSIYNGVGRASRIVQSLRTFSSRRSDFSEIDISEPIEMAIAILYGRLKDDGVVVRRKYSSHIKPIIGNLSELNQVFSNLIDNAIHAMENSLKKELIIETESVNNMIFVKIRDTGTGIPDGLRDKIVEPFFTTKEVGKGTGLGLSITYGIIKKHNGNLTFVSDSNGSCFTVILPAVH